MKSIIKEAALLRASQLAGGRKELATLIGASHDQIKHWLNRGDNIPYEFALLIVQVSGGKVTLGELCSEKNNVNQIVGLIQQGSDLYWLPRILINTARLSSRTSQELIRTMVVDQDHQFITYATFLKAKTSPLSYLVPVIKVDIKYCIETFSPITSVIRYCLLSERVRLASVIKKALKKET